MILSVVVPVFNEEALIIQTLENLTKIKSEISNLEIVVVNDGSTDSTYIKLLENPYLYDKIIDIKINSGKGRAVIEGLKSCKGEFVIIQDADLEYNPEEIPRLWELSKKYELDLLMTTRLIGSPITKVHYFWHKFGNRLITFVFNLLNNTTFTDIYSGYILFRKNKLKISNLKFMSWGQQAEILTYLNKNSNKVYETPISYFGRNYSEGKKIRATATLNVILAIGITRLRIILS